MECSPFGLQRGRRRLVIARDAFGIKPIYYRIEDGNVWFGSEIRTILAVTNANPEPDPTALNLFLRYRFTPSPYTVFKGIQKLAAGTMLVFENGGYSLNRWYRYRPEPVSSAMSDSEAQEELLEIYKRALKRHLLSDVPLGLLLSGGLDSALLLALMNLYGDSWRTFTVGYGSVFADDELADAAKTAAEFASRHTEVLLDRQTFEKSLPRVVEFMEEPVATPSVLPMFFVCESARQRCKGRTDRSGSRRAIRRVSPPLRNSLRSTLGRAASVGSGIDLFRRRGAAEE